MKIGPKSQYAIKALLEIAKEEPDVPVTIQYLTDTLKISQSYLEQIFKKLKACDVVEGVRGPGGGYLLSKPSHQISIADIIDATESVPNPLESTGHGHHHLSNNTPGVLWMNLSEQLREYLEGIKLSDFTGRRSSKSSRLHIETAARAKNFIFPRPSAI